MTSQSSLKKQIPVVGTFLFAVLAIVFLSGCSQSLQGPNQTVANQRQIEWLNDNFTGNDITNIKGKPGKLGGYDSTDIIPNAIFDTTIVFAVDNKGGSCQLVKNNDRLVFTLPGMALVSPTVLTIRVIKRPTLAGPFWQLECGPQGTAFDRALMVRVISTDLVNPNIALYYFNEETSLWETQQITGRTSAVNIYHFSKYGISMYGEPASAN